MDDRRLRRHDPLPAPAAPANERYQILNGDNPYLAPLALGLGGLFLATNRRRPISGWFAALVLTGVAYWYNFGLAFVLGPLVVGRFLITRIRRQPMFGRLDGKSARWWQLDRDTCEFVIAMVLMGLGTVFGRRLMLLSPLDQTSFEFAPCAEWAEAIRKMLALASTRMGDYVPIVGSVGVGSVVWLLIPKTRPAALRCWAVAGVLVGTLVVHIGFLGSLNWVKMSNYDVRYLYPGMVGLSLAAAVMLLGPIVETWPLLTRRLNLLAAVAVPITAVVCYGLPSYRSARDAVDRATGRWTADVLAADCTHVAGDYCSVWPAVYNTNLTLADRGSPRIVWGVTFRSGDTKDIWIQVPPEEMRIGWLIPHLQKEPPPDTESYCNEVHPSTIPTRTFPTLILRVPGCGATTQGSSCKAE